MLILPPAIILSDHLLKARPLDARGLARTAIATVTAVVAPLVFHRLVGGSFLPNSFRAKVGRHGIVAALLEHRPDRIVAGAFWQARLSRYIGQIVAIVIAAGCGALVGTQVRRPGGSSRAAARSTSQMSSPCFGRMACAG